MDVQEFAFLGVRDHVLVDHRVAGPHEGEEDLGLGVFEEEVLGLDFVVEGESWGYCGGRVGGLGFDSLCGVGYLSWKLKVSM